MIIAVDIDDVLSQTAISILKFYNEKYNESLTEEDLKRFVYLGFLGETKEEAAQKLFAYYNSHHSSNVKPMDGAIEAVKKLSEKHQLEIITSRPYVTKKYTHGWINKHFPIMFKNIHFNNRYNKEKFLPGLGEKDIICSTLGATVLIEDNLKYANSCPSLKKVLLFDQPWNQGPLAKNVIRVKDWEDIVQVIDEVQLGIAN